jgi:hypothetical protein
MVAHLWANQSQEHARSGSMSFSGDTLYSYGTPIARIVKARKGKRVALITCHRYSVTTSSNHMHEATGAIRGLDCFVVPSLGISGGRHVEPSGTHLKVNHRANLKHLRAEYDVDCKRALRMYDLPGMLTYSAEQHNAYAEAFGFKARIDWHPDEKRISAARAERNARLKMERGERIAAWLAGKAVRLRYGDTPDGALLRARKRLVETSLGAVVPLADGRHVWERVKACHDAAQEWQANGEQMPVGSFHVSRITADGELFAGCHRIRFAECERFARSMGW